MKGRNLWLLCLCGQNSGDVSGNGLLLIKWSLSKNAFGICWTHGDLYRSIGLVRTEDRMKDRHRGIKEMETLLDLDE